MDWRREGGGLLLERDRQVERDVAELKALHSWDTPGLLEALEGPVAVFPATLPNLANNKQDDTHAQTGADGGVTVTVGDHAAHHNAIADEINGMGAELGVEPAGPYATVRERFEARDHKRSCRAATTAALAAATLTVSNTVLTANANGALPAQDGVTLIVGDRLFVKDYVGADAAKNGIYDVTNLGGAGAPWVLTRSYDADTALKLSDAMFVAVEQGTTNPDSEWELVTNNPITLGTTALRFTRTNPDYQRASRPASQEFMGTGVKLETHDRTQVALSNQVQLTSGTLRLQALGIIRAGDTINSVKIFAATTGAATPTNQWACLVRVSDRAIVAISPTDGATAWAGQAAKEFKFGTGGTAGAPTVLVPYTPDRDELVWVGVMVAAATTPTLIGMTSGVSGQANPHILAPPIHGNSSTGQTTPPAVGTVVTALAASPGAFPHFYAQAL